MAEEHARSQQYEYKQTSNLVLQADRTLIDRRSKDEATGEVQSLVGHLSGTKMGDKYVRTKPSQPEPAKKKRSHTDSQLEEDERSKRPAPSTHAEELGGILYQPKTRETRQSYEVLLNFILHCIGDQPREILCGAADEVLATLKDSQMKDKEKRKEIADLIGKMDDERFHVLVSLGKKITDYGTDKRASVAEEDETIDDKYGVAVVFHDDDEEDQGNQTSVVKDEEEIEEDKEGVDADYDGVLHTDFSSGGAGAGVKDTLEPRLVDAYWLQRELNKFYNDPMTSQKKADEVLEILKHSTDNRDCENKLVLLLGYDQFPFIKIVLKNRQTVLYCTLLARTDNDDERQAIEEEMKKDSVAMGILKALSEIGDEDLVQEELARKAAARKTRVDADLDAEDASQQEKKGVRQKHVFEP